MNNTIVLKISSKSNPNAIAGAIAAGAINQSMKAIAITRSYVAASGVDLVCVPAFCTVKVETEDRTGMKFIVKEAK